MNLSRLDLLQENQISQFADVVCIQHGIIIFDGWAGIIIALSQLNHDSNCVIRYPVAYVWHSAPALESISSSKSCEHAIVRGKRLCWREDVIPLSQPDHPSHVWSIVGSIGLGCIQVVAVQFVEWREWLPAENNGATKSEVKLTTLHVRGHLRIRVNQSSKRGLKENISPYLPQNNEFSRGALNPENFAQNFYSRNNSGSQLRDIKLEKIDHDSGSNDTPFLTINEESGNCLMIAQ